ncbi:hypothetical protein IFM47457_06977 [Aspergillus lentulus]|nr:hypothetical protein IFM47457_06977 [Aspergillus lentulus]
MLVRHIGLEAGPARLRYPGIQWHTSISGFTHYSRMEARVAEGREESAPLVDGEGVRWPVHSFWAAKSVAARSMVSWVAM